MVLTHPSKIKALLMFVLALGWTSPARGASKPLVIPFDFSKNAIGIEVTVRGTPLYFLLDTGVDPSLIDVHQAEALGLKVDKSDSGEASGYGDGHGATVYPSHIEQLKIQEQEFASFEALAADISGLSARYGRRLDGILGYSFLQDKVVLIDYPHRTLSLLDDSAHWPSSLQSCATHWQTPLTTFESFPVIERFQFGDAVGPATLDTGSTGAIMFYQNALVNPGIKAALVEKGEVTHSGARGDATAKSYLFMKPVGFGPFQLPEGQKVVLHNEAGSMQTRIANLGNRLFDAMQLRILLDYRNKAMHFYGKCP